MAGIHEDEYARAVIAEGKRRGITPRGIQIALATVFVESNWVMYANESDPPSEMFFHEAQSTDANSDGLFQQRDPWWGSAAQRMDPTASAGMFYDHLVKYNYNDSTLSPGSFAQRVQGSAYPDRYDQHMGEAVDLYNRLSGEPVVTAPAGPKPDFNEYARFSPNSESRDGTPIDLWLFHTEQGHFGDENAASDVTDFLDNPSSEVSYHYAGGMNHQDGGVTIIDVVDTDLASWSVLSANKRSIDFVFAGSDVNWTRDQWMANAKVIDAACYICAQDHVKYPSLLVNGKPRIIAPDPNDTNVYHSDPPGISDHKYVTEYLHDGTHGDCGPNFPWDYVAERISYWYGILTGAVVTPPVTPPPQPPVTPPPTPPVQPPAFEYPPVEEMIKQLWVQAFGIEGKGWYGLFGASPEAPSRGMFTVEAIAALFQKAK